MTHKLPFRIVAIIQARMSSSRLPGKVLQTIAGEPMLVRVVERTRRSRLVQQVVVATTTEPSDDPIEQLCAERGYLCVRGSLPDVLDRYYQAARTFAADVVVRITADCPVIDPDVVDRTIAAFLGVDYRSPDTGHWILDTGYWSLDTDFSANRLPPPWGRTFPIGLDVEVVSFTALERAWREADQPFHREHVMPYFYEGIPAVALQPLAQEPYSVARTVSPRGFRVAQLHHHPDYGSLRWTVDTPADLELLRQIYARFAGRDDFSWQEVLALFEREPELTAINASVQHKTAFDVDERKP